MEHFKNKAARKNLLNASTILKLHVVTAFSARAYGRSRSAVTVPPPTHVIFQDPDSPLAWAQALRPRYPSFRIQEYPTILLECNTGFILLTRDEKSPAKFKSEISVALHLRSPKLGDWRMSPAVNCMLSRAIYCRRHSLRNSIFCDEATEYFDRFSVQPKDRTLGLGWRVVKNDCNGSELLDMVAGYGSFEILKEEQRDSPEPPRPAASSVASSNLLTAADSIPLAKAAFHSPLHWSADDLALLRPNVEQKNNQTLREQVSMARVGQGLFRKRLENIETACRITGLSHVQHLRASHIKPWRDSNDAERLDGNNGLLLSPHVDHLFDQGYLTFEADGTVLFAASLPTSVIHLWNLASISNVGKFNSKQSFYLIYHRRNVFRGS